jgi:hypothetical protein
MPSQGMPALGVCTTRTDRAKLEFKAAGELHQHAHVQHAQPQQQRRPLPPIRGGSSADRRPYTDPPALAALIIWRPADHIRGDDSPGCGLQGRARAETAPVLIARVHPLRPRPHSPGHRWRRRGHHLLGAKGRSGRK